MVRRLVLLTVGFILASVVSGIAGDNRPVSNTVKKEFRFDVRETERTALVIKNLTHEVDLWHDASLKRNCKRMKAHEKRIFDMIQEDIQARDRVIYRFENEAGRSIKDVVTEPGPVADAPAMEKHAAIDDIKDLRQAKQLVKAKELLLESIKKTDTFSNRYRLLGDYLEIVNRENRLNTVELAEGGRDLKEN
jgi:hypothetical protein